MDYDRSTATAANEKSPEWRSKRQWEKFLQFRSANVFILWDCRLALGATPTATPTSFTVSGSRSWRSRCADGGYVLYRHYQCRCDQALPGVAIFWHELIKTDNDAFAESRDAMSRIPGLG